jgi:hypothetical protein
MRRFAFGGLVLMAVLALALGSALAGEQTQTQLKAGSSHCYCQDGECPGCDCPCGDCSDCLQNRAGNRYGSEGESGPAWHELMFQWLWRWLGGE